MATPKELKKLNGLAKAEACKFGKLGVDQRFFIGNLSIVDKNGDIEVPLETVQAAAEEFRRRAPDTGLMLVTTSEKLARVHLDVPASRSETTAEEWLASTSMGGLTKELAEGEYLKFRDQVINEAFNFLRGRDLLDEESDDDEVCFTFDD